MASFGSSRTISPAEWLLTKFSPTFPQVNGPSSPQPAREDKTGLVRYLYKNPPPARSVWNSRAATVQFPCRRSPEQSDSHSQGLRKAMST